MPSSGCGGVLATGLNATGSHDSEQEVAHLTMVVSDDDKFADNPHQIIPTMDVFTIPTFPKEVIDGVNKRYFLPVTVTAFREVYYQ